MAQTVLYNETKFPVDTRTRFNFSRPDQASMICNAAYDLYLEFLNRKEEVAAFVVFTQSGRTARLLSRYRPLVPIFTFTPDEIVAHGLTINYGIHPFIRPLPEQQDEVTSAEILSAVDSLKEKFLLQQGQEVIVVHGDVWAQEGGTSTIKVVLV
jgi:pyruvate kinase